MTPAETWRAAAKDEFYILRGKAIQAFAGLEQSLCLLFRYVTDTTPDVAGIIFFKIVNASTLHYILDKLLEKSTDRPIQTSGIRL